MTTAKTTFSIRDEKQLAACLMVMKLLLHVLEDEPEGRKSVGTVTISIADDLNEEIQNIEVEVA